MKLFRIPIIFCLALPAFLFAQIPAGYVQTSGTVVALTNGTFGAAWTNLSSSPQLGLLGCVSTFQTTVNGSFDAYGHFSVLLADTAQICPSPSTWTFTFTFSCPVGFRPSAFQIQVPVTGGGGTEDITSQITAALPTSSPCQGGGGGGTAAPYAPAFSIQIANSTVQNFLSDPNIKIDTTAHTLNVGVLPANYVTIGASGTPTSWTFDTTSPATALASLNPNFGNVSDGSGTTTPNQLALSTSTAHLLQYSTAIPSATTATTQAASDNSTKVATTAYVAAPGSISPTSLTVNGGTAMTGNQGTGTSVQHSTGSAGASTNCATYDGSGNVVPSSSATCGGPSTSKTCNANGCYRIEQDGTIEAWGDSSTVGSATGAATLTITFPTSFTSTTHLHVVVSATSDATGDGNPHPADCHLVKSTLSTSGASAVIAAATQIGGSGYSNLAAGDYCSWHALGD